MKKSNWPVKKLGEVATVDWGNTSITKASYKPSGYLAVSATGPDGFMESFEHDRPAIILSAIGAKCGKTFWVEGKWTAIKNTIIIFSNNERDCLTKYLYYFLTPSRWKIVGGGQPFITKVAAESVMIPLPPLATQKAIVERLDAIHKAQELNKKQISLADELFESLIKMTFKIDKGGELKVLGEVVEKVTDGAHNMPPLVDSGIPLLDSTFIDDFEIAVDKANKFISKETDAKLSSRCKPRTGDVLISSRGTIGKLALVKNGQNFNVMANIALIRPGRRLLPEFVLYFLYSPQAIRQLGATSLGTSQRALYIRDIKRIKIPATSLSTQKLIVQKLSAVQEYKKKLLAQKELLQELFDSVLDKAMKGELVT